MTGSLTKVVQITNIAPQATKDQMASLFSSIGKIDDLRLYPTIRDVSCPVVSRICYIKFLDHSSVAVAQHMSNTVFIDRAVVVIPVPSGQIPDEFKAIEMLNSGTLIPGLQTSNSKLPPECINRIEGSAPNQVITTSDPKLEQNELPKYPSLPVNFDARRIEETRRTILVLDAKPEWTVEELIEFFEREVGEVKYGRVAEKDQSRHVMIEFSEQKSVIAALKLQGSLYKGHSLDLYHSTEPITKPQAKSNEAAQKEIEEAMSIVKETQSMISAVIDPMIGIGMLAKEKAPVVAATSRRRSRSRSREPRRQRNRSRNRNRRSRTRSPRRSRSRSRRRSRSRSRSKRSSSRKRRSRSRDRRRKSRSRQRSRSRSRDRRREKRRGNDKRTRKSPSRYRSRSRDRDRERDRKSKRRSPDYPKKIKRDYDDEEKIGQDGSVPREIKREKRARTPSPAKSDHMDLSSP